MHRPAETGMAAAWNRATEAILEISRAVVKVNMCWFGNLGYHMDIHSPLQLAGFLSVPATIYARSSGTVLYFASIEAGSICPRTLSANPQMPVEI